MSPNPTIIQFHFDRILSLFLWHSSREPLWLLFKVPAQNLITLFKVLWFSISIPSLFLCNQSFFHLLLNNWIEQVELCSNSSTHQQFCWRNTSSWCVVSLYTWTRISGVIFLTIHSFSSIHSSQFGLPIWQVHLMQDGMELCANSSLSSASKTPETPLG